MKIAIATFHNNEAENVIGGITTGPFRMKSLLEKLDKDLEIEIVCLVKKLKTSCEGVKYIEDMNELNDYDFIIFKTPGHQLEKFKDELAETRYNYILENLETPFSFIVNEERDREIFPYYLQFAKHPMMKFVMFNSIGMHEDFPDMYEYCEDYVEFNYAIFDNSLEEVIEKAKSKTEKVLTSTARWVPRKRVVELTDLAPRFVDNGFKVKIYGADQSYFTTIKIIDNNKEFWENKGYYKPEDLEEVLSDAQYHYNFVFLKRKNKNRIMRDRIEIATFEALNEGCLPVLCKDTSPKWISDDSAIIINSSELEELPDILAGISDEERLERIRKFYNLSYENLIPNYQEIISKIKESIING